jgi:hypothetical protein
MSAETKIERIKDFVGSLNVPAVVYANTFLDLEGPRGVTRSTWSCRSVTLTSSEELLGFLIHLRDTDSIENLLVPQVSQKTADQIGCFQRACWSIRDEAVEFLTALDDHAKDKISDIGPRLLGVTNMLGLISCKSTSESVGLGEMSTAAGTLMIRFISEWTPIPKYYYARVYEMRRADFDENFCCRLKDDPGGGFVVTYSGHNNRHLDFTAQCVSIFRKSGLPYRFFTSAVYPPKFGHVSILLPQVYVGLLPVVILRLCGIYIPTALPSKLLFLLSAILSFTNSFPVISFWD